MKKFIKKILTVVLCLNLFISFVTIILFASANEMPQFLIGDALRSELELDYFHELYHCWVSDGQVDFLIWYDTKNNGYQIWSVKPAMNVEYNEIKEIKIPSSAFKVPIIKLISNNDLYYDQSSNLKDKFPNLEKIILPESLFTEENLRSFMRDTAEEVYVYKTLNNIDISLYVEPWKFNYKKY